MERSYNYSKSNGTIGGLESHVDRISGNPTPAALFPSSLYETSLFSPSTISVVLSLFMRQHKIQKQNQAHSSTRPAEDKSINLLCSPQFQPYQKPNCSPCRIQAEQSQVTITPVFQQHRRGSSLLQSTQRNTDRKVDVLSVLQMSFSGDESKRQGTATFKNTKTERSSVTSVSGRSRFVESRLERKQAAFQIFQAIKQSQQQLEQRKNQIMKTFGFKPVKAEPKVPSKMYSLKDRML